MSEKQPIKQKKFGTFLGVYLPSLLTVLGLIMYLRFGWVVGNLGLGLTIFIVLLANTITFITGLSAAAIATNIDVGVGGVYYLVSRSLGLETGGAIGVAFYISRTLSITFYSFGLAETVLIFWPEAWGPMPSYAIPAFSAFIILIITYLSGRSAELVLKFQVPMLILVSLSILALIIGVFSHELRAPEWTPSYRTETGGLWVIFAVFFPGVTGFLAGIAMSGDLKNPGRSISRGTLWSVVSGALIYLIIPVLFSITVLISFEDLADPELGLESWTRVAFLGGLFIYPAAWGAILSSAIGSVLSGPRVLQSLSQDGLAPKFLSRLSKRGQPTIATWITGGIALVAVALGDLNTVATFVTVLFLTLYVVINLVAAIEQLVAEPSYRPKIKVPWHVSLVGAAGALFVIYLISPLALLLAVSLELACFIYFKKKALAQQWGDVNAGLWMKVARFSLLQMNKRPIKARNWRPLILLFVRDINDRIELVKLAAAFGQNRGIFTVSKLLFGYEEATIEQSNVIKSQMSADLHKHGLDAFCEVNVVQSLHKGILNISKGHGLPGLKTNTVMFGLSYNIEENAHQLQIIRDLSRLGKNIVLVRFNDHEAWKEPVHNKIDIWWSGRHNNGDLMLILAYMLQLNKEWKNSEIHIRMVASDKNEHDILLRGIEESLSHARIKAIPSVLIKKEEERLTAIIAKESSMADIVFLGLKNYEPGQELEHAHKLDELSKVGKMVVFVQNNSMPERLPILLKMFE
jgi:amino acid transporter